MAELMLSCRKCGETKPVTGFYASNKGSCKECIKKAVRANYRKNIDHYKAYDKRRLHDPERVEARRKYAKSQTGKSRMAGKVGKYKERHPHKRKAHEKLGNALRGGHVTKLDHCESCGKQDSKLQGHHWDYSRPLDVVWLCVECHTTFHRVERAVENKQGTAQ